MNGPISPTILAGGSPISYGERRDGPPSGGAGPVERVFVARPALPCATCAHEPVCAIRDRLAAADLTLRAPESPHEAVRITVALQVECRHHLPGPEVAQAPPEPPRPKVDHQAASRARGAKAAGFEKGAKKPARTAPLDQETVDNIRRMCAAGESVSAVAKALGVAWGTVRKYAAFEPEPEVAGR